MEVVLDRDQAARVPRKAFQRAAKAVDPGRTGAGVDVDVRPARVPAAGEPEPTHDVGVVLEILDAAFQRAGAGGGQHAT